MGKIFFVGKILLVVLFLGILIFVVKYANLIRNTISQQFLQKSVAGAQTSFEKQVKGELQEYSDTAKDQVMNIKISDIVNGFSRLNKIGSDMENTKEYIMKEAGKFIRR